MYKVIVEHRAAKEIEALPNDVLQHAVNHIRRLMFEPRPHGVKKLIGENGWRVRIGDYRLLYTIDDKRKLISVYRVKHRRDAYRGL